MDTPAPQDMLRAIHPTTKGDLSRRMNTSTRMAILRRGKEAYLHVAWLFAGAVRGRATVLAAVAYNGVAPMALSQVGPYCPGLDMRSV